ncbi:hypothetical protein EVAR_36993_1 [Eumeta japonica]|uniref:Uncharacterized protein n=1 Tax=Eumeta variegata TaxID=151549 RepID=A0A4C1X308_EUMVA|nr:hypothetical protein EVAR_36993_1 [Eumeta japonica]
MSGGGSARRPQRSGGGGTGGTLPANGFTYLGGERALPAHTLNNGAPAHAHTHHLNNGSLRSLRDLKARHHVPHPDNFQRNVDSRFSRKQENGYLRPSETTLGLERRGAGGDSDYNEPEYSVIAEGCYTRDCPHSNTFNC